MSPGEPERASLSLADLTTAIRNLPEAGWHKLRKIAGAYARACPMKADDLLQEACMRALSGDRHCPTHVDVVRFLSEVMRSIASDCVKGARREQEAGAGNPMLRLVRSDAGEDVITMAQDSQTPEGALAAEQEASRIKNAVLSLFEDDLIARTIVEGDMEEMGAEEIRSLTELDKVTYASIRRRIRRRIDQAFPHGWRS